MSNSDSTSIYKLSNICRYYTAGIEAVKAVDNISLSVDHGDFLAITGPSGSGKSTLMNILGLLDAPTAGSLEFCQKNVTELTHPQASSLRNRAIGFVFQSFQLLPRTSALENVELPRLYSHCSRTQRRERAKSALEQVGRIHRANHYPNALSGGEQQRVAIARAIVNNPQVILADEPTGALDTSSSEVILDLLAAFNSQGTTIIVITHSMRVARKAKRQVDIVDGKIPSRPREA